MKKNNRQQYDETSGQGEKRRRSDTMPVSAVSRFCYGGLPLDLNDLDLQKKHFSP